jgi:hypothetical protein
MDYQASGTLKIPLQKQCPARAKKRVEHRPKSSIRASFRMRK